MKKSFILILFITCQTFVFGQKKLIEIRNNYIWKGQLDEAIDLLDKLKNDHKYTDDYFYWQLRTDAFTGRADKEKTTNKDLYNSDMAEAKIAFDKVIDYNKTKNDGNLAIYISEMKKFQFKGMYDVESKQSIDNNTTITLTEFGQGKTKDDAKYNALRNALEKAFGAFISSNTTILNDELKNDEIVSLSSGNIKNFEILSETQMPDGSYTNIVKATVSIGKLIAYCESKGISVEFKGSLFAANAKLEQLKAENLRKVLENLNYQIEIMLKNGNFFDYTIDVSEPTQNFYDVVLKDEWWFVKIIVYAKINDNIKNIRNLITQTGYSPNLDNFIPYLEQNSQKFILSNGSIPDDSGVDIVGLINRYGEVIDYNYPSKGHYLDGRYRAINRVDLFSYDKGGSIFYRDDLTMKYEFMQALTLEQISRIKKYKVEPIK